MVIESENGGEEMGLPEESHLKKIPSKCNLLIEFPNIPPTPKDVQYVLVYQSSV